MGYKVSNNAFSTLAGALSPSATSLTVQTGHGDRFPVIAGADYTYITLEDTLGHIEIVKVTARAATSDVLTITRAQDNTTARNWASGDIVELRVIAALLDFAIAHADNATGAHAASAISVTPVGALASSTVQAALAELDSDLTAAVATLNSSITTTNSNVTSVNSALTAHISNATGAHAASAISYAGNTNLSSINVEAALDELDNEKAGTAINNTFTKGQAGAVVALTDASPVALNLALSNNFSLLMTSAVGATRQLANPTNASQGQSGVIAITQDATGGRALTFGTQYKFAGGIAPVLSTTANAVDYLTYYCETTTRIFVNIMKDIK